MGAKDSRPAILTYDEAVKRGLLFKLTFLCSFYYEI